MKVLIIGANSAIARACARLYAADGCDLFLIGRNAERLSELVADVGVRGAAAVSREILDLTDHRQHERIVTEAARAMGGIDLALICHGSLPDQEACESDYEQAQQEILVNGLSVISLLTALTPIMHEQGHGTLAVITSVAGDRGRQPNYTYGAAKALVSTYLQGLRGRLYPVGVHVVDIRPGLVDSPMTAHLEKGPLWSSPERVARGIVRAVARRKHVVYVPGYWRVIMFIVRLIPETLFKRLKF